MDNKRGEQTQNATQWIARLQEPARLDDLAPIAQRFVFSLRMTAVYRQAKRDPLAELTSRLGTITVAVKSLQLVETVAHAWPDPVQVRRCCCQMLSYDELTMAAALQAVANGERSSFEEQLSDLLPGDARDTIWTAASELVTAEFA